jgi:hypothetical protein
MIDRRIFATVFVGCLLCFVIFQNKSDAQLNGSNRFQDSALGIAFMRVGILEKTDSSTYRMTLQSAKNSSAQTALTQVSVTDRLFVDLPGSYGGRLFLDKQLNSHLLANRVKVDSVNTGQQSFRREYWIVYAGMGMWEGVINCSTQEGGRYYVVSLIQKMSLGKPGEEVDGTQLTAENLRGNYLKSLQDTTNEIVNKFTTLLSSVQIYQSGMKELLK